MNKTREFKLHWLNNTQSHIVSAPGVIGDQVEAFVYAMTRAGFDASALKVLDYWEEINSEGDYSAEIDHWISGPIPQYRVIAAKRE